jgi:purine-nucleoside/S-methyl-5'-thioadenosine phosphorylase / adenosine deaminase
MNNWITPNWPAPLNIQALFTTRSGGISSGPYASFNLGDHVGDKPHIVNQNRSKLLKVLPNEPKWLNQVHGSTPIWVDNNTNILRGDAALSKTRDIVCAILTADCLPVFLCDETGTVVGLVHAGWRGLAAGIIEQTIAEMKKECIHIMAYLGPAIGPDYFEVGEEVRHSFIKQDKMSVSAFTPYNGINSKKWLMDIFLLARQRLAAAGVTKVYSNEECTYSNSDKFFSYRRDGDTGRMAGLIWLTK